jgi:RimJ/RimL family protein N-acetyltransferase
MPLSLQPDLPFVPLRGHTPDDLAAVHALWSDPDVVRFITGTPSAPNESLTRLLRYIGHWAAFGFGYWFVEDKVSGDHVGDVGLGRFDRPMTPTITDMPEIGWVLAPAFHGKGYATEAARAALGWMDAAMPGTPTCCIFHPDNTGSMRVAEKLGYSFWKTAQFKGEDTPVYRRKTETGN